MKTTLLATTLVLFLSISARADVSASGSPGDLPPAPKGFDTPRDNIEHGKIDTIEYDSKTVGSKRPLVIYTPPGYSKDKKYPVLYLLHGSGDDETGWLKKGSAAVILDNLYADKKLVPMIVVMPNGFARKPGAEPAPAEKGRGRNNAFEDDLLHDIIPFVDSHYPAIADAEHRAIAGLSMGGGQALRIGLKHLDTFAWIGGFSSGLHGKQTGLIPDATAARQLRLLWLSCGDQDRLMEASKSLHDSLDEQKIAHVWHIDSGKHEWPVWKNDLYLFAPMLFRDK
ncbi:MAG TPA: alpha/beta hydrolase-fold protein [Pirellulales bacterium]|nr:alpha/beta hydrolase-fold protein [Pirellulales bacterium]